MQKARRRPNGAPTACRRTVSGSLSLPCSGCFPPFPHGTGPLSVFREYLALRVGPRCFGQDSSCPALLRWPPCHDSSPVRGYHPLRPAFPGRSGSSPCALGGSYYPAPASTGPVWAPASSLAATGAIDVFFLLLRVLRCFSSPRSPTLLSVTGLLPAGLPHSDTHGSIPACGSPCIFAACRVLPRLRKPRHPPSALVRFSQVNLQHPVSGMPCFSSACEIVPTQLSLRPPAASRPRRTRTPFLSYLVIFPIIVNELDRFSSSLLNLQTVRNFQNRCLRTVRFSETGCKDTHFSISSKFFRHFFTYFFEKFFREHSI